MNQGCRVGPAQRRPTILGIDRFMIRKKTAFFGRHGVAQRGRGHPWAGAALVPPYIRFMIASEGFAKREETLEKQLAQIEGPLTDATSLTPLGQALWRPVRDALYS